MAFLLLSRRAFLAALAAVGAGSVFGTIGCGSGTETEPQPDRTIAYRRSTKSKRSSRAADAHAANRLYVSAEAAAADPAHPGDNARVVTIDVAPVQWDAWFGSGTTVFDMRWT